MSFVFHIDDILKNYDIQDYELHKFRSVYKVVEKDKELLLKKFNSERKVHNTVEIIKYLRQNNFRFCQEVYKDKRDNEYIGFNNKYFACFKWIDGREVNLKDMKEVKKSIKVIYLFHKAMKDIDYTSMSLKDNSDWIFRFEKDIILLNDVREIILNKRNWNSIDKFYYDSIDHGIKILHKLLMELYKNGFGNVLSINKSVCHNSLYYQNLIMSKKDVFLIDFGGVNVNHYVHDLSRFARRVFYKNNFDITMLHAIYKLYNYYYKFNKFEKRLFKISMTYPYKFIRLAYRIYIKDKDKEEGNLISKLKRYSRYELGK